MAGGSITFDTGYLDPKYKPGFLRLALDSLKFNDINNYENISEYMPYITHNSEEFYSSTYFTILNSGFQNFLKNFKNETFFSPPQNITDMIKEIKNVRISSDDIDNREKHLIEYLVYNIADENGKDIWRQDIEDEVVKKLKDYNIIKNISNGFFKPNKMKLIFSSHYKMSLMKKYILRYMKDLIKIEPNEIKEEKINKYTTLNTNKIIYHQIKNNEKNYIKINYYISNNNNISLNQLYKDLGYFNYIKYILDETNKDSLYYNLTHPKEEGSLNIK